MLLIYTLMKCIGGNKFTKSLSKINHLMYMDNIKLFTENNKELETLIQTIRIYSQDIGMEIGIEKSAMFIMKSGKQQVTERIKLAIQERISMVGEKENCK